MGEFFQHGTGQAIFSQDFSLPSHQFVFEPSLGLTYAFGRGGGKRGECVCVDFPIINYSPSFII